jgi:hypothetical protein
MSQTLNIALNFIRLAVPTIKNGYVIMTNPLTNKGMSFSDKELSELGVRGLIPGGTPLTLNVKTAIALEQFFKKSSPIDKYIFLHTIQDSDETLFYSILINHIKDTMPFVYTPTVGQACQEWSNIYRHTPRGLYITSNDKGRIAELLDNYPLKNIKVKPSFSSISLQSFVSPTLLLCRSLCSLTERESWDWAI